MSNAGSNGYGGHATHPQYQHFNAQQPAPYQQYRQINNGMYAPTASPTRYTQTSSAQFNQFGYPMYQSQLAQQYQEPQQYQEHHHQRPQQLTTEQFQYAYQQFQQRQQQVRLQAQYQQNHATQQPQQHKKSTQSESVVDLTATTKASGTPVADGKHNAKDNTNINGQKNGAKNMIGDAVTITPNMLNPAVNTTTVPETYLRLARGLNTTYRIIMSKTRVFKFTPREMIATDNKQSKVTPTAMYFISRLCEHSPHLVRDLQFLVGLRCMFCEKSDTYASGSTHFVSLRRIDSVGLLVIAIQRMKAHMLMCPATKQKNLSSLLGADLPVSVLTSFFHEWHKLIALKYPERPDAGAIRGLNPEYLPPATFAELRFVPDEDFINRSLACSLYKARRVALDEFVVVNHLTELPCPPGKMSSPFVEQLMQNARFLVKHDSTAEKPHSFQAWMECGFCHSQGGDNIVRSNQERRYLNSIVSADLESAKFDGEWFSDNFVCHHETCKLIPSRMRKRMRRHFYERIKEKLSSWMSEHFLFWSCHIRENLLPRCETSVASKHVHEEEFFKPIAISLMGKDMPLDSKSPVGFSNPVAPANMESESKFGPHDVVFGNEFCRNFECNRRFRHLVTFYRAKYWGMSEKSKERAVKDLCRIIIKKKGGKFWRHSSTEEPLSKDEIYDYVRDCFDMGFLDLMRPPVEWANRKPGSYVCDLEFAPTVGILSGRVQWPEQKQKDGSTQGSEEVRLIGLPPNDKLNVSAFDDPHFASTFPPASRNFAQDTVPINGASAMRGSNAVRIPPTNQSGFTQATVHQTVIAPVGVFNNSQDSQRTTETATAGAPSQSISSIAESQQTTSRTISQLPYVEKAGPSVVRTADNAAQVAANVSARISSGVPQVARTQLVNTVTDAARAVNASSGTSKPSSPAPRLGLGIGQKRLRLVPASPPQPASHATRNIPHTNQEATNRSSVGKRFILNNAIQNPEQVEISQPKTAPKFVEANAKDAVIDSGLRQPTGSLSETLASASESTADPQSMLAGEEPAGFGSRPDEAKTSKFVSLAFTPHAALPSTDERDHSLPPVPAHTDDLTIAHTGQSNQAPSPFSTTNDNAIRLSVASEKTTVIGLVPGAGTGSSDNAIELDDSSNDDDVDISPELAGIRDRMQRMMPGGMQNVRKRKFNAPDEPPTKRAVLSSHSLRGKAASPEQFESKFSLHSVSRALPNVQSHSKQVTVRSPNKSVANSDEGTSTTQRLRGQDAPGHRGIPKKRSQSDRKGEPNGKNSLPTSMKEIYTTTEEDVHSTITEPEDASRRNEASINSGSVAPAPTDAPAPASLPLLAPVSERKDRTQEVLVIDDSSAEN